MKKAILEAIVVIAVVLLVFLARKTFFTGGAGELGDSSGTDQAGAATAPSSGTEDIVTDMSAPFKAEESATFFTQDESRVDDLYKKVSKDWKSCMQNDPDFKTVLAEGAKSSGIPEDQPEVYKSIPVRDYLFRRALKLYSESGCPPKAKRPFLYAALNRFVNDEQDKKSHH